MDRIEEIAKRTQAKVVVQMAENEFVRSPKIPRLFWTDEQLLTSVCGKLNCPRQSVVGF